MLANFFLKIIMVKNWHLRVDVFVASSWQQRSADQPATTRPHRNKTLGQQSRTAIELTAVKTRLRPMWSAISAQCCHRRSTRPHEFLRELGGSFFASPPMLWRQRSVDAEPRILAPRPKQTNRSRARISASWSMRPFQSRRFLDVTSAH